LLTISCETAISIRLTQKLHMPFHNSVNRPWTITYPATGRSGGVLRIGKQTVPLSDLRSVSLRATQEKDFLGSLLNYSAYLIVAAVFMVLVVQAGWRERFLLATIFFAIVGFTSLVDIGLASRIRLYRLSIETADGRTIDFTTADAAEADRLTAALATIVPTR
jgi:Family of unknown function (DUF6232)